MANLSAIKLPNGTTYNLKDSVSGYTTNTGTITRVKTTAGTHSAIDVTSGAASFNVPTHTSHLTNDSGFLTAHQTLYEENINWGPTSVSKSGSVSPIGMALSSEHSCNRLAYINGAALTFEYSSNGGSTYTDYGYTAANKSAFCTTSYGVPIGRTSGNYTTSSRTRITLTAQNGTTGYVYTNPKKLLINISSSGGMQVLIEYRTGTNYQNNGTWNTFGTYTLSGWSGWNDIPLILGTLGGGTNQTSNNWQLRLTFIMTSVNSNYPTTAQVNSIRIFGENGWTVTSNMGSTGHLYAYDNSQNATFPAQVAANGGFSGNLTGNVTGNVSGTAANVTGTVAIANGGTGQTTAANAINALLNGLPVWTADPTDTTYFVRQDTGGSASYGKVAFSTIWNYIGGKLPSWSKASTKPSYTASEVGALASNTTYVSTVTTSAGTHSTISSKSGAVSFNVPTKTSHLTNDSGFITNAGVTSVTTTAGAHTTISSATGAVSFKVPTKTSHLTNDSGYLTSHQTIKQDGITGATVNRFGTCGTAAGTAAKTVSITTGTFSLEAGAEVTVKFTNANTAGTPTLNVNSTGAKNIFHRGAQITTGANKALLTGTVKFIYDGTQWHLIGDTWWTGSTTSITPVTAKTVVTGVTKKTVVTGGSTTNITPVTAKTVVTGVTKKTVVTGGSTTSITPVTSKTVVTSASGATASYSGGVLTLTNGSFSTGASVTAGTAVAAYTSLTTGDSVTVTTGDSVTAGTAVNAITSLSAS